MSKKKLGGHLVSVGDIAQNITIKMAVFLLILRGEPGTRFAKVS